MHAQHENGNRRRLLKNAPGGNESIDARQGTVHHNQTRLQFLRQTNRLFAVTSLPNDDNVRGVLEDAPKSPAYQAVIVDQQDGNLMGHATPTSRWELSIVREFRPPAGAEIQYFRPTVQPVRAWRPAQVLRLPVGPQNLDHDLQLPLLDHSAKSTAGRVRYDPE